MEVALGDTHKPEAILPSLTPFAFERFFLLRQIVVNWESFAGKASLGKLRWGQTWVKLGFRFSTELQTAARKWEALGEALGDTHKPGAILPSLKPFSLERFFLLRQIVVNCFNSKEINSVHLIA